MNKPYINSEGNEIPEKVLMIRAIDFLKDSKKRYLELLEPMSGWKNRDWFHKSFYSCLPVIIGNQYGFVIKAERDFTIIWNGEEDRIGTTINLEEFDKDLVPLQEVKAHFGWGVVTIEMKWNLRAAPNTNLMSVQVPNYFKRGVHYMTGVIEIDNLERNFIFNLKITEPNHLIKFKKGEPLAAFILVPRGYVDEFEIVFADELFTEEQIKLEEELGNLWDSEMNESKDEDGNTNGRGRYFRGKLVKGGNYFNHQMIVKKYKRKND